MKYLFKKLILVITIYFSLKIVFYIIDNHHEIKYNIGNFEVEEEFNLKNGNHIYSYTLTNDDFEITFDVNKNFKKKSKILKDIKYYEDEKCILPIFLNGEIIYNTMCKEDNTVYFNYDKNNEKKKESKEKFEINTIYKNNIKDNQYLFVENYKGITLINNEIRNIKLFENDVYKKEISVVADKYYLVANYNEELTFKSFYLINLINGKQKEIRSANEISFDSYIQGVVSGKIYLYDMDSKVQYEIDPELEQVTKIATNSNIKYYNGKWTEITLKEALDKKMFAPYETNKFKEYDKVDKLNNYYVYEKNGNYYNVYLISPNNLKQRTFLFKTSDISSVTYLSESIYFKKDNIYYSYSNEGVLKIIENEEMKFNTSLKYGVYEK